MDQLQIEDLEVYAYHGVFDSEKQLGQKFLLCVTLEYDMTQASTQCDLSASVHYGELAQQLTTWCQAQSDDLIETLAYRLVCHIFEHYPISQKVSLTVKKPWAPIGLPLNTCSVTIVREKQRAFIGLGTNQGNPEENLQTAIRLMQERGLVICQQSDRLQTQPWGYVEQPSFLNQVVQIETVLTPNELLNTLLAIEQDMGRVREQKWGPRVIDLDILCIGEQIIYTDHLIVPHPYMAQREFVLAPMAQIAPHFIHPVLKQSIQTLLEQLKSVS